MERKWTPEQQDAIDARNGTVLVSAAAGSGKTAVLVQRFIERITDPEHPTDADRMLVVTFTRAAAGEMRERILSTLNTMIARDPANAALRRQKLCFARAHISTVHGFCSDLLREFFCRLDIAPDFRVADDKEEETLMHAACDTVLEEAYADAEFEEFAGAFSGERDDGPLKDIIFSLYRFTQSHPFPQEWLEEKLQLYTAPQTAEDSVWGQTLLHHAQDVLQGCIDTMRTARDMLCDDEKLLGAFDPVYADDVAWLQRVAAMSTENRWDELVQALNNAKFATARAPRGYAEDSLKLRVAAIRDEMKAAVKKLAKLFPTDSAGCVEELRRVYPYAGRLAGLILRFTEAYEAAKKEKGLLDFSDLEHMVLRLLYTKNESGERFPGELAAEIAGRFDEIMVDEYQDTNEAQDKLFAAVSKEGKNLFMVGDVKQSIYGFRQAMPQIFLRYKKEFTPFERAAALYPACITLDRNFRSRREVTESVNFVFSQLMSETAGDVDYTGTERLTPAAAYPESAACTTELAVLPRDEDMDVPHAEALWIARRIKGMLESGFTVSDHGEERPARPGDFCVLLRAANRTAHTYASVITESGVPAKATLTGSFFGAAEIRLALSFLRAIDNPAQDIPLLAMLMSPVYGFTPDEVAKLRADTRSDALVTSLTKHPENPKCARVLEDLETCRRLAGTMTSEMFLNYLLEKTGLEDVVLAMEDGPARLENLRMLRQYAASYESSGYHGVSAFLRFIDQLAARKGDLEAADPLADTADAVKIMSIHKSKGLEFPVCIVAGCGRQFVTPSADASVHPELGLGLKLRDAEAPVRYTTMPRDAILTKIAQSELSEELRVLYVALTRAREKLIMVGSLRDRERTLSVLSARLGSGETVSPYAVKSVHSVMDWLLLCALRHPDGARLRELCGRGNEILAPGDAPRWEITLPTLPEEPDAEEQVQEVPALPDEAFLAKLRENAAFVYPWEGINALPSKVAVTTIAEAHEPGEYPLAVPAFLQAKEMTPAERGTAVHAFLQFLDLQIDPAMLEAECRRLVEQRFITERQLSAVELPQMRRLLSSELGERIRKSPRVLREYRFSVPIPAAMAAPETPAAFAKETVVLQGAVDCMFEEEGRLWIVDFKTDRVQQVEELKDRYQKQLELYSLAVEETTGEPVAGRILYSVRLGKSVAF